jgi:hypothetical protein
MGRPKKEIPANLVSKAQAMRQSGVPDDKIALAVGVPLRTLQRKLGPHKAQRAKARKRTPKPTPAPATVSPSAGGDDLPENLAEVLTESTPFEQIDRWLKKAEEKADKADADDDDDNHVKYVRLAKDLFEARRKAMPIPKEDPNEHPDMLAAASKVRERWHALAENLARVSNSPVAETIGRMLRSSDAPAV